jgi:beta-lactamase regulating signal transducer with metallopeptidase domain/uncharacterized protein YjbI with pentapeptide repeats
MIRFGMNPVLGFDSEFCASLCLTLAHSLWQIALLALVATLVVRSQRGDRPERSYAIYVVALLAALAALPITFAVVNVEPMSPVVTTSDLPIADQTSTAVNVPAEQAKVPKPAPVVTRAVEAPKPQAELLPEESVVANWMLSYAPWLVGCYFAGVVLMVVRLGWALWKSQRLARHGEPLTVGPVAEAFKRLIHAWEMRIQPALTHAQDIVVPQVVGLLRPTILLPTSALSGLTPVELEMILAHELAHVRRLDMWVNLVQRLAEAALFFNPALWYLSRQISTYREYCCDEQTCRGADTTSHGRVQYAQALLRVVQLSGRAEGKSQLAALAATGNRPSELRRRVARLFGEPLREPVRISRSGLVVLLTGMVLLFTIPMGWQNAAEVPAKNSEKTENPQAATEADLIVAAARQKTFGLHNAPRVLFQQTYRQAEISTMQGVEDGSLSALWRARRKEPVVDAQLGTVRHRITLAWDGSQLLINDDAPPRPGDTFIQSRFWDGKEGWLSETTNEKNDVKRFSELSKLTEDVMPFYVPQWVAAGGRLPWSGPEVVLREDEVSPTDTRYRSIGEETIDGVVCEVYEGPERHEIIWIGQTNGLVKAVSRHFVSDFTEAENWKAISDAAGREFADPKAYIKWFEALGPLELNRFGARWAAVTWPHARPGYLAVFSDYQEVVPGVQWPMKAERIHVHEQDRDGKKYYFTRAEIVIEDASTDFDLQQHVMQPTENIDVDDDVQVPPKNADSAKIAALKELVDSYEADFERVETLHKLGVEGGEAATKALAQAKLSVARADLAQAEGKLNDRVKQLSIALVAAEELVEAQETRYASANVTLDAVLAAKQERARIKILLAEARESADKTAEVEGADQTKVVQPKEMRVKVVDTDGKPLEGAWVFRNLTFNDAEAKRSRIKNETYYTDKNGETTIKLEGEPINLHVWVKKESHVPLVTSWRDVATAGNEPIPAAFEFRMTRGTKIGGIVTDVAGIPIAGVKVEVEDASLYRDSSSAYRDLRDPPKDPPKVIQRPGRSNWLAYGEAGVLTDAEGKWSLDNVPTDAEILANKNQWTERQTPLRLRFSHPDYETIDGMENYEKVGNPSLESLRDGSARTEMKWVDKDAPDRINAILLEQGEQYKNADFSGRHFKGQQLMVWSDDMLAGANLTGSTWEDMMIPGVGRMLYEADLTDSRIINAQLIGQSSGMQKAKFTRATLETADISGGASGLQKALFTEATITNSTLRGEGASFQLADFQKAKLHSSKLSGSGPAFQKSNFDGARLLRTTISCNSRTAFQLVKLNDTEFVECDLSSIDAEALRSCEFDAATPPRYDVMTKLPEGFDPEAARWKQIEN